MELVPKACPEGSCRYFPDCEMTRHHTYWPRKEYTTPIEKRFRNLAENVGLMCMAEHQELHMTTPPPEKPTRDQMLEAINGHRES